MGDGGSRWMDRSLLGCRRVVVAGMRVGFSWQMLWTLVVARGIPLQLGWQASSSQLFRRFVALLFGRPSSDRQKKKGQGGSAGQLGLGLGIHERDGQAVRGYRCILQREFLSKRRHWPTSAMASTPKHGFQLVTCGVLWPIHFQPRSNCFTIEKIHVSPLRRVDWRQQTSTTLKEGRRLKQKQQRGSNASPKAASGCTTGKSQWLSR